MLSAVSLSTDPLPLRVPTMATASSTLTLQNVQNHHPDGSHVQHHHAQDRNEHSHGHKHEHKHSHNDEHLDQNHSCDHDHDQGDTHDHSHVHDGGCGHAHEGWRQYAPHGHSLHSRLAADKRALTMSLIILTLSFVIQISGAIIASSNMLVVEALHSMVDGLTVLLSLISTVVAAYPPSARMSYGYGRAEVLSALLSLIALAVLCVKLTIRAFSRIYASISGKGTDVNVNGRVVVLAETITLVANIAMTVVLARSSSSSLNIRAVRAHVIADSLENIVVLAAGAIIWGFPSAGLIDPILSVLVVLMLILLNLRIAQETVEVLMQAAPTGIIEDSSKHLQQIVDVIDVKQLHVWTVTTGVVMGTVRVVVPASISIQEMQRVREQVSDALRQAGVLETCVEVDIASSSHVSTDGLVNKPVFQVAHDSDENLSLIIDDGVEASGVQRSTREPPPMVDQAYNDQITR